MLTWIFMCCFFKRMETEKGTRQTRVAFPNSHFWCSDVMAEYLSRHACNQNDPIIHHEMPLWKRLFGPARFKTGWALTVISDKFCLLSTHTLKLWSKVKYMPNCLDSTKDRLGESKEVKYPTSCSFDISFYCNFSCSCLVLQLLEGYSLFHLACILG